MLKNVALVVLAVFFLFSCETENEANDASNNLETANLQSSNRALYAPWVFVMDWRYGRTCGPGGGVCFSNGDGDILIFSNISDSGNDTGSAGQVFETMMANDSSPQNGFVGYQRYEDKLRVAFSRGLGERSVRISEDVILTEEVSRRLGVQEITLKAGDYVLDFTNLEHGEALIDITVKEIELDQHAVYGAIDAQDFPVGGGLTVEAFMEDLGVTPDDLVEYRFLEGRFTGTAAAEHLINGEIVYVWHTYENEPIFLFEGELSDGGRVTMSRISWCGNEFGGWNSFDFFWDFIDNGCSWC
ncbi:hypothetical protein [uncultured Dokdonia sp.]|uniref:hypothetical protein n=1 Tax=uncultured Dokdonia sp. TaxID=575653 RepID=UPI00260D5421|nr:hypothetical protein [uncultured Dokdonia sp.]